MHFKISLWILIKNSYLRIVDYDFIKSDFKEKIDVNLSNVANFVAHLKYRLLKIDAVLPLINSDHYNYQLNNVISFFFWNHDIKLISN